ncbi:hypothetical protein CLOM_g10704, partial [Closterium sp. NIES-68]
LHSLSHPALTSAVTSPQRNVRLVALRPRVPCAQRHGGLPPAPPALSPPQCPRALPDAHSRAIRRGE